MISTDCETIVFLQSETFKFQIRLSIQEPPSLPTAVCLVA